MQNIPGIYLVHTQIYTQFFQHKTVTMLMLNEGNKLIGEAFPKCCRVFHWWRQAWLWQFYSSNGWLDRFVCSHVEICHLTLGYVWLGFIPFLTCRYWPSGSALSIWWWGADIATTLCRWSSCLVCFVGRLVDGLNDQHRWMIFGLWCYLVVDVLDFRIQSTLFCVFVLRMVDKSTTVDINYRSWSTGWWLRDKPIEEAMLTFYITFRANKTLT